MADSFAFPGRVQIPSSPLAPGTARLHVRTVLAKSAVHEDIVELAGLLTSEIVTNAVRHTTVDTIPVSVTVDVDVLVEVWDDDARPLKPPVPADVSAITGRGLQMLDQMAAAWGWLPDHDGKTVWFQLPTAPISQA